MKLKKKITDDDHAKYITTPKLKDLTTEVLLQVQNKQIQ